MSQGTAKKLVGQQASTDSAPVVLSNEQESILSDIAGASSNTDNQLLTALQAQGTAISSIYPIVIAAEDSTSGNSDILKSDAGSLLVRFASNPTVIVSDAGGPLSIDDNGTTISIDDGGGSITIDGSVGISGTPTIQGTVTADQRYIGFASVDQSFTPLQLNNIKFFTQLQRILY